MAIYHFSIGKISRAKGRSSVQKMAYICCTMAKDERTNRTFRYLTKQVELVHTETSLPKNAPDRWKNPTTLWNEVEQSEKKSNAKIAYDMDGAFPNELTHEQMIEVCRKQAKYMTDKGFCMTWAIHDKEDGNPHVHILATTRPLDKNGNFTTKEKKVPVVDEEGHKVPLIDPKTGNQKIRKRKRVAENGKEYYSEEKLWQTKKVTYNPLDGRELYKEIRQSWADICNEYLPEEEKISPLSNKARGIEQTPSVHIGAIGNKIDQRDEYSWKKENYLRQEVIRTREIISKMIEEKLEQARQLQKVIQTKMQSLKEYVTEYIKKKIEKAEQEKKNNYPSYYQVILDSGIKDKKLSDTYERQYKQLFEKRRTISIQLSDVEEKMEKENRDYQEAYNDKKYDEIYLEQREQVLEPLKKYHEAEEREKFYEEERKQEENKFIKSKKKIEQAINNVVEARKEKYSAEEEMRNVFGKSFACYEARNKAERLVKETSYPEQIAEAKKKMDIALEAWGKLNSEKQELVKQKKDYTTVIDAIETYSPLYNGDEEREQAYQTIVYGLYSYVDDSSTPYKAILKPIDTNTNESALKALTKLELLYNEPLNDSLDVVKRICVERYEERESLYEQCNDARDLIVEYNERERGYSVFVSEDETLRFDAIVDPKDNEVKVFGSEEEASDYMQELVDKINSYKEENGIEIEVEEERSYGYSFGMHM